MRERTADRGHDAVANHAGHEIKNPLNFVNNFPALSAELIDELNDVLKSAALRVRAKVDE
jgi:hypothetical protein